MQQFVFSTRYTLHYNTKNPVPISKIIEALTGIEKLLKSLPNVTRELTNTEGFDVTVEIDEIHSGSLWETIVVNYTFGSQEKLDEFIAKVRKVVPPNTLVPVLIASLLAYGGYLLLKTPAPIPGESISLSNITNSVININGTQIPASMKDALLNGVKNKKELANATIMTLAPAKDQPGSSLKIEADTPSDASFEFTSDAIALTPEKLDDSLAETTTDLSKVVVSIRATDLDNKEKGWAGKIEGLTGRVRIELAPEVDVNELAFKKNFLADVTLTSKTSRNRSEPKVSGIYVHKIHPPGTEQ